MHSRAFTVCSSFVALAAISGGCSSSSEEAVTPKLEIINRTASAIQLAGSITAVHGTYGGACESRTGAWVVDGLTPGNTTLSVVKNDTACVLTMTSIDAGSSFSATPAIAMATTYATVGSGFALSSGGDTSLKFYGNAKMSAVLFASDFVISLVVSDSPRGTDAGNKGADGYASRSATLTAGGVPAPDYTIALGSFGVTKDINNVVDAVSGFALLGEEGVSGEDFAVVSGAPATFAAVDAAFSGGSPAPLSGLATPLELPASGFALPTVDLDTSPQRTVIIRHTVNGVSSYEMLTVTFTP
ncbi:MAG TPA: hypothetical protein VLT33_02590 [Labilithrix sp.]|nr:hypothetical protein [Labilithrix sp.]